MNNKLQLNIAQQIKSARLDAQLTQTELGIKVGKSKQWVSEVERGNISISCEMLARIADVCNKPMFFLSKKSIKNRLKSIMTQVNGNRKELLWIIYN